jgi:TRAP-type C4-dicarboxylate transport system permease small subunit
MPIEGTYDLVGLLTATGLGLALANCAQNDGNIAMSIVTDKLSKSKQQIIELMVNLISLGFWAIVVWRMFIFANALLSSGRVSATASIPIYPFAFLLGFSVFCLCLVLLFNLNSSIRGAVTMFRECTPEEGGEGK